MTNNQTIQIIQKRCKNKQIENLANKLDKVTRAICLMIEENRGFPLRASNPGYVEYHMLQGKAEAYQELLQEIKGGL